MKDALADFTAQELDVLERLTALIPPGKEDWRPDWPGDSFSLGELRLHLEDATNGLRACLKKLNPNLDFSHTTIAEAWDSIHDDQLASVIATYFSPAGEAFLLVYLKNLQHLGRHLMQLYIYLKILGVPVSSSDLYGFAEPD